LAINYINILLFIGIGEISSIDDLENLGINKKQLSVLIDWLFRKNNQNRSRVLGNNDNLTKLLLNHQTLLMISHS
jgi:hypothetical protein